MPNNVVVQGDFGMGTDGAGSQLTLSGDVDLAGAVRQISVPTPGAAAPEMTISGIISNGGLVKDGPGTLRLSGNNPYTGGTTISAGTLQLGDGGTTGTLGTGTVINNAALVVNRSGQLELDQVISGSGTLTNRGSGTLVLSGENTYTGTTIIENGTIALAGDDRLPTTTALSFSSAADTTATLDLGGYNQRIGALTAASGSGGSIVNSGDVTSVLTIDPKSGQHTYDDALGTGDFTIEGGTITPRRGTGWKPKPDLLQPSRTHQQQQHVHRRHVD